MFLFDIKWLDLALYPTVDLEEMLLVLCEMLCFNPQGHRILLVLVPAHSVRKAFLHLSSCLDVCRRTSHNRNT